MRSIENNCSYEIPKNFACGALEGLAGRTTYPKVGAL